MTDQNKYILCPYCGHPQSLADQCASCNGVFEPLSRKATQIAMGPWFIRDRNMPFRPGCSFEVLKKQIETGRVKPNTVLRGPTTHQFWSVARNTPGISHLLGYCHECNSSVSPSDTSCHSCKTKFVVPSTRNELGLLYPTQAQADRAQTVLQKAIDKRLGRPVKDDDTTSQADTGETRAPVQGGIDLLDQVLGAGVKPAASARPAASHQPPPLPPAAAVGDAQAARQLAARSAEPGFLWAAQPNAHQAMADHADPQPHHQSTQAAAPDQSQGKKSPSMTVIWLLVLSNLLVVGLLVLTILLMNQAPQS